MNEKIEEKTLKPNAEKITSKPDENELLYREIKESAEQSGYFINPDKEYVLFLMDGLLTNKKRFSYPSCPCRLASGEITNDRDIICPCDYRDPDLEEFGACYCSLYVSKEIADGKKETGSIPERRPEKPAPVPTFASDKDTEETERGSLGSGLSYPVWRCKVCGYLCARDLPPEICPICKAGKERFERFI